MKKILTALTTLLFLLPAMANDSMYFTNGSQLVPLQATDIRLRSEVLTITLLNDGFAQVDVLYQLDNQGAERDVTMGFEADAPYMGEDFSPNGVHPHISNFRVEMNGATLAYRNALVRLGAIDEDQSLITLDPTKWKNPSGVDYENDTTGLEFRAALYNAQLDSVADYAYAYYFTAHFRKGLNTVHHTYRYRIGISVGEAFFLAYKLTPALRWQGGQIDDFTLIIRAENTFKHFFVYDAPFGTSPVWAIHGTGKKRSRQYTDEYFTDTDGDGEETLESVTQYATEFALRNAEVRFHATNFRPAAELGIVSGDVFLFRDESDPLTAVAPSYDPGRPYISGLYTPDVLPLVNGKRISLQRVRHNLPFAARGYVFKDSQLKRFFSSLWWYMPDASYKADVSKLLPVEREWIERNK